jgi:hypothetical protein
MSLAAADPPPSFTVSAKKSFDTSVVVEFSPDSTHTLSRRQFFLGRSAMRNNCATSRRADTLSTTHSDGHGAAVRWRGLQRPAPASRLLNVPRTARHSDIREALR